MSRSRIVPLTPPCMALAVISASSQSFDGNRPINRTVNACTINFLRL
jgi:hypothetical protein